MHSGYELLWLAAERTPDHVALVDDVTDRKLTYAQLVGEIEEVAAGLHTAGIEQGSRVATALPTTWEHAIFILALMRLNAVPALLNFRLKPDEIASLCEASGIQAAAVLPEITLVKKLREAIPNNGPIWCLGDVKEVAKNLVGCRADPSTLPVYEKPPPEDAAFLYYTSGTTGLPKAVVLAHRSIEPRILWLSTQGGLRHGVHNRALGCMPLSHAIGFFGVFLVTLAFNGTFFVVSEFNPTKIVDLVNSEKLSYAFCIPTMYQAMVTAPNYSPEKFSSMELTLYGGVSIDPGLLDHIHEEWGGAIRHIYGTTETMCSLYHPEPAGQHATLRPGYYCRTRVVRVGGEGPDDIVDVGEEGELVVDSSVDTIFTEYLGRPDEMEKKVRGGWYYTGDIFRQEANGDITIVGRVDDMIRSGGESIHPEEIEAVLSSHALATEVSVIGLVDAQWGQMVTACIKQGSGDPASAASELDAHCKASALSGFKRPKAYFFTNELPRNAANKVLRRLLRDEAEDARVNANASFQRLG